MKNLQKMKIFAILLSVSSVLCSFVACSSDNEDAIKVYEYREQIGKKIKELTDLQASSTFGVREGMYPEESKLILEGAIDDLKDLLEAIKGKALAEAQIPEETAKRISNADQKIEEFLATVRTQDVVIPGELHVNGKNGGYVDFGTHPEYSAFPQGFTVDLWFKFEDIGAFDYMLSTFIDNEENDRYRQGWAVNYYGENGEKNLRMTYVLGKEGLFEPWVRFEEKNKWIHLAFVWNPANADDGSGSPKTFKMYVDGDLLKEEGYSSTNYTPNTRSAMIGFNHTKYDGSIATDGKGTNGYMKHMHIWNTVKSRADIRAIMENPDAITGGETDLVCGWRFAEIPYDNANIKDLTGKYSAKLAGDYEWKEIK
ncbi:MAG: DUF4972 domain-containing protein [Prevotellaceae bacterium]|jgi:hypothetical protein|nr:DUF4972 domain-containing protein [Prevotellaceae bacterium]